MYFLESAGGLGNQLFIWNFAHLLANEQKSKVVILFPGVYKDRENHLSELSKFCSHNISVVDYSIIGFFMKVKDRLANKSQLFRKLINKLFRILELEQPEQVASENQLKDARLIRGFHQSSSLVQDGFDFFYEELKQMTEATLETSIQLSRNPEVFINGNIVHVRRGDFETATESIGVLTTEYYTKIIRSKKWLKVVIISDAKLDELQDLNELQKHQKVKITKFDGLSAWEDFSILCQGRNLIIANSTFSWWAAQYVIKMKGNVFAPKPWNVTPLFSENYLHDSRFSYHEATFSSKVK